MGRGSGLGVETGIETRYLRPGILHALFARPIVVGKLQWRALFSVTGWSCLEWDCAVPLPTSRFPVWDCLAACLVSTSACGVALGLCLPTALAWCAGGNRSACGGHGCYLHAGRWTRAMNDLVDWVGEGTWLNGLLLIRQ